MNDRNQLLHWESILKMPFQTRNSLWPKPDVGEDRAEGPHLRIGFRRDEKRYPIISTLVAYDADRFYRKYETPEFLDWWIPFFDARWGQPEIRKWYDAYITLTVQGPPNLSPEQHPTMTEARKLAEIEALENQAAGSDKSEYITRVLSQPQGQRLLAANKANALRLLSDYQWTPERLVLMGFDPETRAPILKPDYWVNEKKAIRLTVPDSMLEGLRWHDLWHNHHVLAQPELNLFAKIRRVQETNAPLVLVGAATGMTRVAVRPLCTPLPDCYEAVDAKKASESAYATVGQKLGSKPFLMTCQQLAPIHGGQPVDTSMQLVTLSALDWAALVDARAGSMSGFGQPLTTVILRDLDLNTSCEFASGPIRLRRKQGGEETGDEYEGVVLSAKRMLVDDLVNFSDEEAQSAGKPSAADLHSQWRRVFADLNTRAPEQQKLWCLKLAPVAKDTYRFYKPEALPVAHYLPQRPAAPRSPRINPTPSGVKEAA